jgi:hypothetical protein
MLDGFSMDDISRKGKKWDPKKLQKDVYSLLEMMRLMVLIYRKVQAENNISY